MNRLVLIVAAVVCVAALASPVAAQQTTDTPTPESGTETADQGPSDRPVTSPSGSPVTYDSPTPTSSGSGPGFGVAVGLVAGLVGAVFAVRRRP